jgi:hypothetical protein
MVHVGRRAGRYALLAVLTGAVAGLVAVAVSCSSKGGGSDVKSGSPEANGTPAAAGLTQTDDGSGGVTVAVTWQTEDDLRTGDPARYQGHDLSKELLFRVKMDTHSVNLSQYDLRAISLLRDGGGQELMPQAWEVWTDSQHHREGLLVFQRPPVTEGVQLIIQGLAGTAQRVFRWEAGSASSRP